MATLQFSEGTDVPVSLHRRKQLLPNIIDGMANTRPWALYAETPRSLTTYDAGYRKITYGAFANAINGVAWLLEKRLGRGKTHETLVYVGPNDLGYIVMILGAVKAGYKVRRGEEENMTTYNEMLRYITCSCCWCHHGIQYPTMSASSTPQTAKFSSHRLHHVHRWSPPF